MFMYNYMSRFSIFRNVSSNYLPVIINVGLNSVKFNTKPFLTYVINYKLFFERTYFLFGLSVRRNVFQDTHASRKFHTSTRNEHYMRYVAKLAPPESKKNSLSHTSLMKLLQECKTVAEQIDAFHSAIKLQDEDIALRSYVCKELECTLKLHFPNSALSLVGSSVNGFGLKDCDADFTFKISDSYIPQAQNTDASSSKQVYFEKISTHDFPTLSPKNQLLFIQKILQQSGYEDSFAVIPGRCPILNFFVKNISCDLAIDNRSAQYATNLMLLCGKLDHRVVPLMCILTYWAKHLKLIGGHVKFKSYALFLLILYYLQTRHPPILPTVDDIFSKTDFLENTENWSNNVSKYVERLESSENSQSIEELLREFFFFYGNFDFSWVICTRTGSLKNARSLVSSSNAENKFELNTISIQDPLNPHWNVTTQMQDRVYMHFNICWDEKQKSLLSNQSDI